MSKRVKTFSSHCTPLSPAPPPKNKPTKQSMPFIHSGRTRREKKVKHKKETAKLWTQNGVLCPKTDIHVPPARDSTSFFPSKPFSGRMMPWEGRGEKWRCRNFSLLTSSGKDCELLFLFFRSLPPPRATEDTPGCVRNVGAVSASVFLFVLLCAFYFYFFKYVSGSGPREWSGILLQKFSHVFTIYCAMIFYSFTLLYLFFFFYTISL